jgi:hypothetical protein
MFLKKVILKKYFKEILDIVSSIDETKFKLNEITCTKNGYQTVNIVSLFNKDLLKNVLRYKNFHKHIFHIHFIEYKKGGYQTIHNHFATEKYSFIIYLNNSDGNTVFYNVNNKTIKIKPKERTLLIFDSGIDHQALESYQNKKILVGAIFKK